MKRIILCLSLTTLLISCAVHHRSNVTADEEFVVELKKPVTRGGVIETAIEGLFYGVNFLAEKSAKSLSSSYSQSISVNDYYNTDLGEIEKTYKEIHIKKYSKPKKVEDKSRVSAIINSEFTNVPKTRGSTGSLTLKDVFRSEQDDLLNFHAVFELISDPENPGITRISFTKLIVLFSKTKVFQDENLNAKISLSITGQWRTNDGTPMSAVLIEQEYELRNLKYGFNNQIQEPILSPWYYDIPIASENSKYGVLQVNVQLEEYEGKKSKYINKLPSILSENKNSIIKNGASTIQKIIDQ